MQSKVYNIKGEELKKIDLPEEQFGLPWNADLVSQVVISLQSSQRKPVAHTKTRGEVRGGGKKPWKQKGLGRARHGSIRSPIWVGGGVSHGPRKEKNFSRKVNSAMKKKALYTILSAKQRDNEVLLLDSITLSEPKTKEALRVLKGLGKIKGFEGVSTKRDNRALLLLSKNDKNVKRSFRNFSNIEVLEARNLDPLSLLKYKYLVIENPETFIKSK